MDNFNGFGLFLAACILPLVSTGQTPVTDIDGNVYTTVQIGEQEWMAENLRVTRYQNGDEILHDKPFTFWQRAQEGIWTWYEDDQSNEDIFGKLYNWYATSDPRGLCPQGWRIPTESDWEELTAFIDPNAWGNNNTLGTKLKSRRQVNSPLGDPWDTEEQPRWDRHGKRFGTDNYGFAALPAGGTTMGNSYTHKGKQAYFWSKAAKDETSAWVRTMLFSHRGMSTSAYKKQLGFSVRCIKGDEEIIPNPHTLSITVTPEGAGSATGSGQYEANEEIALTAIANDGYQFTNWTLNGDTISTESTFTFTMPAENVMITANFEPVLPPSNKVIVQDVTGNAGEAVTITVDMENSSDITAFQMDFVLPEGFEYVEGSLLLTDRASNHDFSENIVSNNTLRIVAWSNSNELVSGTEGALFTFSLVAPLDEGTWPLTATEVTLTNRQLENVFNESVAGTITIESATTGNNTIKINDAIGSPGSEIVVEVEMTNLAEIIAFQMDIVLPEGFSYVNESYQLSDRAQDHAPSASMVENNTLRLLAHSMTNSPFTGNSGTLFNITLIAPNMTGSYTLDATNVIMTNAAFENVFEDATGGSVVVVDDP